MTTDQDKCSLRSVLPVSCRNRTETFARHLQSRLNSLGSQNNSFEENENSCSSRNASLNFSELQNSTDSDVYFEFSPPQSPSSPEDEIKNLEVATLINNGDSLRLFSNDECQCSKNINNSYCNNKIVSNDSDSSDGTFYDLETELEQNLVNGIDNLKLEENANIKNAFVNGTLEEASALISHQNHCNGILEVNLENIEACLPISNGVAGNNLETEDGSLANCPTDETRAELDLLVTNDLVLINDALFNHTDTAASHLDNSEKDEEIYCSTLNVGKDLTVECPNITNGYQETAETENITSQEKAIDEEDKQAIEDLEIEETIPRVRRCSSLKTGKTPPGTPGRKKIVRFADVLGLDLADVRTFLDEIPKIPNSAYDDLQDADLNDPNSSFPSSGASYQTNNVCNQKLLVPLFQQPGGQANFLEKVRENFVCLENAVVEDPASFYISGSVRVRNLDFHKSVHIRYTLDAWKNYADVQGTYVQNSCDGFSDKFTFFIYAHPLTVGQQLEFAVRFSCKGSQYWDNNNGINYRFECLPASNQLGFTPIIGSNEHDWGVSFYYQDDISEEEVSDTEVIQKAVQEYVTSSLGNHNNNNNRSLTQKKSDVVTLFIVLIFSFLFMFIQKAIYFAK